MKKKTVYLLSKILEENLELNYYDFKFFNLNRKSSLVLFSKSLETFQKYINQKSHLTLIRVSTLRVSTLRVC